jgi:hypothetical protein
VPSKRLRVDDSSPSPSNIPPPPNETSLHQQIAPSNLTSDLLRDQQSGAEHEASALAGNREKTSGLSKTQNGASNPQNSRAKSNQSFINGHDTGPDRQQLADYIQLPQQGLGTMANFHPIYFEDTAWANQHFDHGIPNLSTAMYSTVGGQVDQRSEVDAYGFAQSPLNGPRIRPLSRISFVVPGVGTPRPQTPFGKSLPNQPQTAQGCRYLVLVPLLQHINGIIPASIACDLLDFYFAEPSSSLFESASPYVLTHIFRKKSFLHATHPRTTSPALLAAMLWATAQTSEAQIFKTSPTSRGRICDRLFAISLRLLNPSIHESPGAAPGKAFYNEYMVLIVTQFM